MPRIPLSEASQQPQQERTPPPYLILGDLELPVIYSPKSAKLSESWRYSVFDRLGGQGNMQLLGKDNLNLDLSFSLKLSSLGLSPDPTETIFKLRDLISRYQKTDEWLTLVWGDGTVGGDYVISDFQLSPDRTDAYGDIWSAVLDISLIGIDPEITEQSEDEQEISSSPNDEGFVYSDETAA
jgi:phage protein U